MANSFLTLLNNLGNLNGSWFNARSQLQKLISYTPHLLSVQYTAGGTPSGSFAALWSPYACPDVALVMEGTTLWFTTNGGSSWANPTIGSTIPTGTLDWSLNSTLKSGYLWVDGSAQLIASYSALNTYLNTHVPVAQRRRDLIMSAWTSSSQATFTISNNMNGLANGDVVNLYWNSGSNSRLSMTVSGASTSSMTVSGGSGDSIPNSVGSAAAFNFANTKFIIPDSRGRVLGILDNLGALSANRVVNTLADLLGGGVGTETHTLITSEIPSHQHAQTGHTGGGASVSTYALTSSTGSQTTNNSTLNTGGGGAHNNMQPTLFVSLMIKT